MGSACPAGSTSPMSSRPPAALQKVWCAILKGTIHYIWTCCEQQLQSQVVIYAPQCVPLVQASGLIPEGSNLRLNARLEPQAASHGCPSRYLYKASPKKPRPHYPTIFMEGTTSGCILIELFCEVAAVKNVLCQGLLLIQGRRSSKLVLLSSAADLLGSMEDVQEVER